MGFFSNLFQKGKSLLSNVFPKIASGAKWLFDKGKNIYNIAKSLYNQGNGEESGHVIPVNHVPEVVPPPNEQDWTHVRKWMNATAPAKPHGPSISDKQLQFNHRAAAVGGPHEYLEQERKKFGKTFWKAPVGERDKLEKEYAENTMGRKKHPFDGW